MNFLRLSLVTVFKLIEINNFIVVFPSFFFEIFALFGIEIDPNYIRPISLCNDLEKVNKS